MTGVRRSPRGSRPSSAQARVLIGVLVLVVAGAVYLVIRIYQGLGPTATPQDDGQNGKIIVACGFLAFILGRLAHRFRPVDRQDGEAEQVGWGAAAVTRLGLFGFFAAGVVALSYEGISLWKPSGVSPWNLHPITDFVRHAKQVAPWTTGIVTVVVSFLVGHWLWPPSNPETEAESPAP